jgi:hypothetical protein
MYTTEIFMAYIRGRAAYKIVTPYKTVIRVLKDIDDVAVLEALRATRTRDAVLITKSNIYELLFKGASPRDDTQRAIQKILFHKNITFERIDEASHRELVDLMKEDEEAEKVRLDIEGQKRQAQEQAANGTLDKLPYYLKDKILKYAETQRKATQLRSDLIAELDIFQVPFQSLAKISSETGDTIAFGVETETMATDGLAQLINGNYKNINKIIADIEKVFLHYANKKSGE